MEERKRSRRNEKKVLLKKKSRYCTANTWGLFSADVMQENHLTNLGKGERGK